MNPGIIIRTVFHSVIDMAFPAHVAAYVGDLEHLRMLVDNQIVNVNERDDKGSTPAHKGIFIAGKYFAICMNKYKSYYGPRRRLVAYLL